MPCRGHDLSGTRSLPATWTFSSRISLLRCANLKRSGRGAGATARINGGSRTQSFALWSRAYEPQTTFPAFTVVLTFIAFTPCLNRWFSHCLLQASRPYEPQTTFPAFTVVLIFIAFSSCPQICGSSWIKAVVVPIRTKASGAHAMMPATLLKRRVRS